MFWVSVKSAFRQWYVAGAAFLILTLLDKIIALPAPTDEKWGWLFVLIMAVVKGAEKAIRAWVTEWSKID